MKSIRTKDTNCPCCNEVLGGAINPAKSDDDNLNSGDIGICAYCGTVLRLKADLSLEEVTDEEIANFTHEQRMNINDARRLTNDVRKNMEKVFGFIIDEMGVKENG